METFICPICQKETTEFPALSRKDNKTEICSDCGTNEALEDYYYSDLSNFVTVIIAGEVRRIHKDLKAELDKFINKASN